MRFEIHAKNSNNKLPTGDWTAGSCPVWFNPSSFGSPRNNTDAGGYFRDFHNYYVNQYIQLNGFTHNNLDFVYNGGSTSASDHYVAYVTTGFANVDYQTITNPQFYFRVRIKSGWNLDSVTLSGCSSKLVSSTAKSTASTYTEYEIRFSTQGEYMVAMMSDEVFCNLNISPVEYTVTFNKNYSGSTSTSSTGTSVTLPSPTRTGYTLSGWYTAASGGTKVGDGGASYTPTANITLYAHWTAISYTIAFNGNGYTSGSTASISAKYGTKYTLTANGFVRKYTVSYDANSGSVSSSSATSTYTFKNWNTKADGSGTSYSGGAEVSNLRSTAGTITLYAQWQSASVTLPTATKTGYNLNGWYTAASGGTKVGNGGASYTPTADIALYAQWSVASYTVSFNANGGSCDTTSKSVTYNSTYGDLPTPTRTGYTFAGWYTAASGGTKVTSTTTVTITAAQTLYAHWTAKTFTVTFNANGGSVSTSSKSVTYNSTYGDLPTPTRATYSFAGWYTATTGGSKIESTTKVAITANQTLYARWAVGTYYVKFDGNGATSGSMSNQTFSFGTSQKLTANAYKRRDDTLGFDYDFLGWSKNKSATSAEYTNQEEVINLGSDHGSTVTLYAVWRKKVKITVRSNDVDLGTVNDVTGYYSIGSKITLTATIKDSATIKFVGWYIGDVYQSKFASYEIIVDSTDTEYEAVFRSIAHTLHVTDPSRGGDITVIVNNKEVEVEKDNGVSVTVLEGQSVELLSKAEYNFDATHWSITENGKETQYSGDSKEFIVTESNAKDIYAAPQFTEKPKYSIRISKSGRGSSIGVISLTDSFGHTWTEESGSITADIYVGLQYTAHATISAGNDHVLFEGWYQDGAVIGTERTLNISQSEVKDRIIVADFKNTYHTLNVSSTKPNYCYLEAKVGDNPIGLTGVTVADGQYVTVKATPSNLCYLNKWQISSIDDNINNEVTFQVNQSMGDVIEAKAEILLKDPITFTATKQNGEYGTISVSYNDCIDTSTGELKDVKVVYTEDLQGKINTTIYKGVEYTAKATLTENLSQAGRQLSYFEGWYHQLGSEWKRQTGDTEETFVSVPNIQARFEAYALHSVDTRVISGEGSVNFDYTYNDADVKVEGSAPQWIEGQAVKIVATPEQGYEFKSFSVKKVSTGTVSTITGNREYIITGIDSSYEIEVSFSKIKCPVTFEVDSYSLFAGNIIASVANVPEPDFSDLYYGDIVTFTAQPNEGYQFDGWYIGGERVSTETTYTITLSTGLSVIAKFKAQVTLSTSSSISASGNVFITAEFDSNNIPINWKKDEGGYVSVWVTLGDNCAIKAESSRGVFGAWYNYDDSDYFDPLDIADNDVFQVLGTTHFVGRFISDDDYLYIALFNDWLDPTERDDSVVLGLLSMTNGERIGEDEYNAGIKDKYNGAAITGAYAYYKFLGSRKSLLQAIDNSGRVFNRWERSLLSNGDFTDPENYSSESSIPVNTNRDYIFTAYWGTPKPVDVKISLLEQSRGLGTLRMDNETSNRVETDVSISDTLMQGVVVSIAADAKNGYKFVGWYEDSTGTKLHSKEQNLTFEVRYAISLYAKFEEDRNAIYRWEGSEILKAIRWKSKIYVSSKPFDPVCARVDATGYSVGLKVDMFSSPNSAEKRIKDIEIVSQDARRLPRSRPERFCQISLTATNEINSVFVGTNMQELAV